MEEKRFIPTIGVFAGILNQHGRLLLRKRTLSEEKKSQISDKVKGGEWELPGGTVEDEEMILAGNENGLVQALKREIREEIGFEISISLPLRTFPVVIAKELTPGKITRDVALLVIVESNEIIRKVSEAPFGECLWSNTSMVNELAKGNDVGKLVSGWGKRMHRMSLIALLYSGKPDFSSEAQKTLDLLGVC